MFTALTGAAVFSALAVGTAAAAPTVNSEGQEPVSGAVAPAGFIDPGPSMIVKRSVPVDRAPASETVTGATANTIGPKVTDKVYQGQQCGTNVIQQTSGQGKTTLVLTVSKSVSAEWKSEGGISAGVVSAGIGFSVTKSYTVENQTRYEVPRGKFGTVQAYPLYDKYSFNATMGGIKKPGWAMKPVGVCFNQWLG
ncbi:hypothetical protein AB0K71_28930 [Streptomyces syringium]|uniref:hypothetical protein n=1 Tax=Streptomyces syringium TaxID=76729 RepID=UPI00341D0F6E